MLYYMRVFAGFMVESESEIGAAEELVRGLDACRPPGEAAQLMPIEVSTDRIHWTVHHVPLPEPRQKDAPTEDWKARAEAAEARAAQAEADALTMLATLYEVGVDLGLALVEDMYDHGFTEEECIACGALGDTHAVDDPAALLAPLRRILASVQP